MILLFNPRETDFGSYHPTLVASLDKSLLQTLVVFPEAWRLVKQQILRDFGNKYSFILLWGVHLFVCARSVHTGLCHQFYRSFDSRLRSHLVEVKVTSAAVFAVICRVPGFLFASSCCCIVVLEVAGSVPSFLTLHVVSLDKILNPPSV